MTALSKLTSEERDELTRLVRSTVENEREVDNIIENIEEEIAGIVDTQDRLTQVVRAYIPDGKESKIVIETIEEWLIRARKSLVAERMVRRNAIRAYTNEDLERLLEEREDYLWDRADLSGLISEEEPSDAAIEDNVNTIDTPNLSTWLLIGLTALQIASIILQVQK